MILSSMILSFPLPAAPISAHQRLSAVKNSGLFPRPPERTDEDQNSTGANRDNRDRKGNLHYLRYLLFKIFAVKKNPLFLSPCSRWLCGEPLPLSFPFFPDSILAFSL